MTKNTVAAILGCLYVAVTFWIVGTEGRAHRAALHQAATTKQTATASEDKADSREIDRVVAETATAKEDAEAPRGERSADERRAERSARRPRPAEVVKKPPGHAPVPPEPNLLVKRDAVEAEQTPPKPAESLRLAFARAVGADVSTVRPADVDPFWSQPFATKKWDVASLSAEDERQLGADLHAMVMNFNPRYEKPDAQERVERAARPLLPARSRKEIDYQFFVLDSNAINAFSHPGGYIYVNRGLLDWISTDEDCALQFALAHEIFHVDRKHALRCLQDPGVKSLPYGTVQLFYLFIFPRGYYPEQMDFDADAWALLQLQRLQCTRRECLTFMRKLKGYAEANKWGLDRASALPQSGKRESLFDNHFRAHPPTFRRLEKLEALVQEISSKSQ